MAWKKTKTAKKTKKSYKPKFKKQNPVRNLNMVVAGKGFPKKMIMTHKYFETFDIATTSGATQNYQFSCNGLYDPNITGSGHQPYLFDQMSLIYNSYTCIGAKATFTISPSTGSPSNASVALWINDDTTVNPTLYGLMEQSSSKYRIMPANRHEVQKLSTKWSAKKTHGAGVMANNEIKGVSGSTSGSNPTEQSYFVLSVFPQDLSSTITFNVQVMIEYIAVWTELRDIGSS